MNQLDLFRQRYELPDQPFRPEQEKPSLLDLFRQRYEQPEVPFLPEPAEAPVAEALFPESSYGEPSAPAGSVSPVAPEGGEEGMVLEGQRSGLRSPVLQLMKGAYGGRKAPPAWDIDEGVDMDGLTPGARSMIEQISQEAARRGHRVRVTSARRSADYQRQLRERWDAGDRVGLVTRPAEASLHEQGRAVDLTIDGNLKALRELGQWAEAKGYGWGGDADPVHFVFPSAPVAPVSPPAAGPKTGLVSPPARPEGISPAAEGPGLGSQLWTNYAASMKSGVHGLGESVGGLMEWFGTTMENAGEPSSEPVRMAGHTLARAGKRIRTRQAEERMRLMTELEAAKLDPLATVNIAGHDLTVRDIISGAFSSIPFMFSIAGTAPAVVPRLAGSRPMRKLTEVALTYAGKAAPKLAAKAVAAGMTAEKAAVIGSGAAYAAGFNSLYESGEEYATARAEGAGDETANQRAAVRFLLNTGTAFTSIVPPGQKALTRGAVGALMESAEEAWQDVADQIASGEEVQFREETALAAVVGALIGAPTNLMLGETADQAQARLTKARKRALDLLEEAEGDVAQAMEAAIEEAPQADDQAIDASIEQEQRPDAETQLQPEPEGAVEAQQAPAEEQAVAQPEEVPDGAQDPRGTEPGDAGGRRVSGEPEAGAEPAPAEGADGAARGPGRGQGGVSPRGEPEEPGAGPRRDVAAEQAARAREMEERNWVYDDDQDDYPIEFRTGFKEQADDIQEDAKEEGNADAREVERQRLQKAKKTGFDHVGENQAGRAIWENPYGDRALVGEQILVVPAGGEPEPVAEPAAEAAPSVSPEPEGPPPEAQAAADAARLRVDQKMDELRALIEMRDARGGESDEKTVEQVLRDTDGVRSADREQTIDRLIAAERKLVAQAEAAPTPKLPRDLAGAKPRYGYRDHNFELGFSSDLDKALFIIAQRRKSPRDADYREWLSEQAMNDAEMDRRGRMVRSRLKDLIAEAVKSGSRGGYFAVPHLDPAQFTTPDPPAQEAAPSPVAETPPHETLPVPAQEPASALPYGVTVRKNPDKGSIEITFAAKPPREVLGRLKDGGQPRFRWSRGAKVWHGKDTPERRDYVRQLFGVNALPLEPGEILPPTLGKKIGKNRDGQDLYEDEEGGGRYFVNEDGIRQYSTLGEWSDRDLQNKWTMPSEPDVLPADERELFGDQALPVSAPEAAVAADQAAAEPAPGGSTPPEALPAEQLPVPAEGGPAPEEEAEAPPAIEAALATDDPYDVLAANFSAGYVPDDPNEDVAVADLKGGVRMSDPREREAVEALAAEIRESEHINRIIVDDDNNVMEGQHRLEAAKLLGQETIPIVRVVDLGNKYQIEAMTAAAQEAGRLRDEQAKRVAENVAEILHKGEDLSEYEVGGQLQAAYEAAYDAGQQAATEPAAEPATQEAPDGTETPDPAAVGGRPAGDVPADEEGRVPETVPEEPGGDRGPDDGRSSEEGPSIRGGKEPSPSGGVSAGGGGTAGTGRPDAGVRVAKADYTLPEALEYGGPKARFKTNIEAIQLLKVLEAEGRNPTREEKESLSRYVGWGGIPQAFDASDMEGVQVRLDPNWARERAQLREALTPEEYRAARSSTQNAHYTALPVVRAMWEAAWRLGYRRGRVLEPAVGVGNFLGASPKKVRPGTRFTAVELDDISGRIATQLYGTADVKVQGFQATALPDNYFDMAISNVPFGSYTITDRAYGKSYPIHNYFFVKSLDKVRPGGLVAFITSHFTLDAKGAPALAFRRELAEKADMVGAIRLPSDAFKENANTEVTTDIIFLRKKGAGDPQVARPFQEIGAVRGIEVNEYFANQPEMMLGEPTLEGTMRGNKDEFSLKPIAGHDLGNSLAAAIKRLPEDVMGEAEAAEAVEDSEGRNVPLALQEVDGQFYRADEKGTLRPFDEEEEPKGRNRERLSALLKIRDATVALFAAEADPEADDAQVSKLRKDLNRVYDRFAKKFKRVVQGVQGQPGAINDPYNERLIRTDPAAGKMMSLEKYDYSTGQAAKMSIFTERITQPRPPPPAAANLTEGLSVSLAEKGRVDPEYIAELIGSTENQVIKTLVDEARIYEDPETGDWHTSEHYLSGDIMAKMRAAEDAGMETNARALEEHLPPPKPANKINFQLGASWLPPDYVAQWISELLGGPVQVRYNKETAFWDVAPSFEVGESAVNTAEWGTDDMSATTMVERFMNHKPIKVMMPDYDNLDSQGRPRRVVDPVKTAEVQAKLDLLKERFKVWVMSDDARTEEMATLYNRAINVYRDPEFDGSHLTFPGMAEGMHPYPHQANAVWRILQDGRALLAHVVGSGKTLIVAAAAMENRRLGLARKQAIVVLKSTLSQWRAEFQKFYPQASVLVASEREFTPERRRAFLNRMQTGNWDAIILTHEQFGRIPLSEHRLQEFKNAEVARWLEVISALRAEGGNEITVKEMEAARDRMIERIDKMIIQQREEDFPDWDSLGVDFVYVDEAHYFKNLFFSTRMGRVANIGTPAGAQRSLDLYMKSRALMEANNNRGLVFATGTPVTNTMTETWTMMRYLQADELETRGTASFDGWAGIFGAEVTVTEPEVSGQGYRTKQRFAEFMNVNELSAMFRRTADVRMAADVNLATPEVDRELVEIPPTQWHRSYVFYLTALLDQIRRAPAQHPGGPLRVVGLGSKAALSARLISPELPEFRNSKVSMVADRVVKIWKETAKELGTQLIFSDLGTPKPSSKAAFVKERVEELKVEGLPAKEARAQAGEEYDVLERDGEFENPYTVYDAIKEQLIARGVPAAEIAFIHDFNTDKRKQRFGELMNAGKIRIVVGSTPKMGVGLNVQKRLYALHHLDAPWKPAEIEQREGRIERQGNMWRELDKSVKIITYVTQGTFDTYRWGTLKRKHGLLVDFYSGNAPDVMKDIDEESSMYELAMLGAMDDPEAARMAELEPKLDAMRREAMAFQESRIQMQGRLKQTEVSIARDRETLANAEAAIALRGEVPEEGYSISLNKAPGDDEQVEFANAEEASKQLWKLMQMTTPGPNTASKWAGHAGAAQIQIGTVAGLPLFAKPMPAESPTSKLYKPPELYVAGKFYAKTTTTPVGTWANVMQTIRARPEGVKDIAEKRIPRLEADLPVLRERLQQEEFPKEAEMGELTVEHQVLSRKLLDKGAAASTDIREQTSSLWATVPVNEYGDFADGVFDPTLAADEAAIDARKKAEAEQMAAAQADRDEAQERAGGGQGLRGAPSQLPGPEEEGFEYERRSQEQTSRPEVVRSMERFLEELGSNAPIRTGHVGRRRYAGVFKEPSNVIRSRHADDLPVLFHEIGHAIEWHMYGDQPGSPWTKKTQGITHEMIRELTALGKAAYPDSAPEGSWKSEGMAEFARGWFTGTPDVQREAPAFWQWWQANVVSDRKIRKAAEHAQRLGKLHGQEMSSRQRVEEQITGIGPRDLHKRVDRLAHHLQQALRSKESWNWFRRKTVETGVPLQEFADRARENAPAPITLEQDPYEVMRARRGTADSIAAQFVERSTTSYEGDVKGPSLKAILSRVKGQEFDFVVYAFARRAKALLTGGEAGREPRWKGATLEDLETTIAELDTPLFRETAELVYQWNLDLLEYAAKASPGFRKTADDIIAGDVGDYVPTFPDMADFLRIKGAKGRQSMRRISYALKGWGGSTRNPIAGMIHNARRMIQAAHIEEAAHVTINLARLYPDDSGEFAEKIDRPTVVKHKAQVKDMLDQISAEAGFDVELKGVDGEEIDPETVLRFFGLADRPTDPLIVQVVNGKGKTEWWRLRDENLLKAVQGTAGKVELGLLGKTFHITARVARMGYTQLSMPFAFWMNPTRDMVKMYFDQDTEAQKKFTAPRLFAEYFRQLAAATVGTVKSDTELTEVVDMARRIGATHMGLISSDINQTERAARNITRSLKLRVVDPRNWFSEVQEILSITENVPRLTEMKMAMREVGYTKEKFAKLPPEEKRRMIYRFLHVFRDITGDFRATGEGTRKWSQQTAFVTSYLQGNRISIRQATNQKTRKRWWLRGGMYSMAALYLWWQNKDDRDEDGNLWLEEVPWRYRWLYHLVRIDNEVIAIPKAHEIGLLFGSLPEALAEAWYAYDKEGVRSYFDELFKTQIIETVAEVGTPPIFPTPIIGAAENLNNFQYYFDRPIEPRYMEFTGVPQSQRYGTYTAKAAILAGKHLDYSPYKIEHAIRSLTGTVGGQALHLLLGTGEEGRGSALGMLTGQDPVFGDSGEKADMPIAGRAFKRGGTSPFYSRSWEELRDEHQRVMARSNDARKPETEKEKAHRLMIDDAFAATNLLGWARTQTKDAAARRELSWERAKLAKAALQPDASARYFEDQLEEYQSLKMDMQADQGVDLEAPDLRGQMARLRGRINAYGPTTTQGRDLNSRYQRLNRRWKDRLRTMMNEGDARGLARELRLIGQNEKAQTTRHGRRAMESELEKATGRTLTKEQRRMLWEKNR